MLLVCGTHFMWSLLLSFGFSDSDGDPWVIYNNALLWDCNSPILWCQAPIEAVVSSSYRFHGGRRRHLGRRGQGLTAGNGLHRIMPSVRKIICP